MSFDVAADAYDRFMGRYSVLLSPQLADLAGVAAGQRAIDVGCGPGALTARARRPARRGRRDRGRSVGVVRRGHPRPLPRRGRPAGVRRGPPVRGRRRRRRAGPAGRPLHDRSRPRHLRDAPRDATGRRASRPASGTTPAAWVRSACSGDTARELDPDVVDESDLPGTREGHLRRLFIDAGLHDVTDTSLAADLEHPDFDAWWEPFAGGVGPAGAYVAGLSPDGQARLRERLRDRLPDGPFVVQARAWAARGIA